MMSGICEMRLGQDNKCIGLVRETLFIGAILAMRKIVEAIVRKRANAVVRLRRFFD